MLKVLFAGDLVTPVEAAERGGDRRRRCRDRLEAGIGQHQRREAVPGVGHDEATVAGVQRHELLIEFGARHVEPS